MSIRTREASTVTMAMPRLSLMLLCLLGAATALAQPRGWQLEEKQDPLTDEAISTATWTDAAIRQGIVVRCKAKKLEAYVSLGEFLGSKMTTVRYRIDKQPLVNEYWSPSSDGTAVFARQERGFSRALLTGTTLVVEATDFRGQPHRATFELEGASVAIEPVLRACAVPLKGMEEEIPGLRAEIARDLERWGPTYISTQKEILTANNAYAGPIDSTIEPAFALAAQRYYDDYVEKCRAGKLSGVNCNSMKISWKAGREPSAPVGSIVYETATGSLKSRAGKLHIGD